MIFDFYLIHLGIVIPSMYTYLSSRREVWLLIIRPQAVGPKVQCARGRNCTLACFAISLHSGDIVLWWCRIRHTPWTVKVLCYCVPAIQNIFSCKVCQVLNRALNSPIKSYAPWISYTIQKVKYGGGPYLHLGSHDSWFENGSPANKEDEPIGSLLYTLQPSQQTYRSIRTTYSTIC